MIIVYISVGLYGMEVEDPSLPGCQRRFTIAKAPTNNANVIGEDAFLSIYPVSRRDLPLPPCSLFPLSFTDATTVGGSPMELQEISNHCLNALTDCASM